MSSKFRDEYHGALSPEALRMAAARFHDQYSPGDAGHMDPNEVDWFYESRFPLHQIGSPEQWQAFMKQEIQSWIDGGEPTRFSDMIHRPIQDPVIILVRDGKVYPWDGNHRIGACALSGRKSVPAIVGRPKIRPLIQDDLLEQPENPIQSPALAPKP